MESNIVIENKKTFIPSFEEYLSNEKHAKKNADTSDDINAFEDAGLILQKDIAVLDIDCLDKNVAKMLAETFFEGFMTTKTERGLHIYFDNSESKLKSSTGRVCVFGFKVEIKTDKSNRSITEKRNGKAREMRNAYVLKKIPTWFFKPNNTRRYKELLLLNEGAGRNNELRYLATTIQDLDEKDIILDFVNKYIFAKSLDDSEFKSCTRDLKRTNNEEMSRTNRAAYDLVERFQPTRWNGLDWIKNDGIYKTIESYGEGVNEITIEIQKENQDLDAKKVKDAYFTFKNAMKIVNNNEGLPIRFSNGTLINGTFIDTEYKDFTPFFVPYDYIKNHEKVEVMDEFLNNMTNNDAELRQYLLEIFASMYITDCNIVNTLARTHVFVGEGSNNKTTLFKLLRMIVGKTGSSSVKPEQFVDDNQVASMVGKLLNAGDDFDLKLISGKVLSVLKNVSTGDEFSIRRIYSASSSIKSTATQIFSTNNIPSATDSSMGLQRRLKYINIGYTVTEEMKKNNPNFFEELSSKDSIEYLISLVFDALQVLLKNKTFSKCEYVENYNKQVYAQNDSISEYFDDNSVDYFRLKSAQQVREEIAKDVLALPISSSKVPSVTTVSKMLKRKFNLVSMKVDLKIYESEFNAYADIDSFERKSIRVYVKESELDDTKTKSWKQENISYATAYYVQYLKKSKNR